MRMIRFVDEPATATIVSPRPGMTAAPALQPLASASTQPTGTAATVHMSSSTTTARLPRSSQTLATEDSASNPVVAAATTTQATARTGASVNVSENDEASES